MTFKEAKDILKKEFAVIGLHKSTEPFEFDDSNWFGYEKPSVLEAFRVLSKEGYYVTISGHDYNMRENRLKKEYEENTKAPNPAKNRIKGNFPGNKSIEYCGDSMPGPGEEQPKEGNPALKEAASQFNDALLDELRKKIAAYKKLHFYDTKTLKRKDEIIEELRDKNAELLGMVERMKENVKDIDTNLNAANETNKCLNKKVVELSKIKGDLNSWISGLYFCIHHNNDNYKYKLKRLGKEISKLNSIIHDKNAVLSDVAEELRLSKIREKNLVELGLKYVGENEELKKELANKVVDKIDAQALKSAESALAYKDKVIADLTKKLNVKHKKYVYYNGTIVAVQRLVNTLAGYAAKRYYKELCDQMVDIAEEGGDQSASIVVQCDNGITLSKEEAEIIERCTKNGTELHYSEKDGFTYTNVFDEEMPIRCLRGMFHVFTDEEIENMKK